MDLTIKINLDNAAFDYGRDLELRRIFAKVRADLAMGEGSRVIQG